MHLTAVCAEGLLSATAYSRYGACSAGAFGQEPTLSAMRLGRSVKHKLMAEARSFPSVSFR